MSLPAPADGSAPGYYGVYPAIVTDIVDKDSLGRIEVKFPFLGKAGEKVRAWATLCTPYADDGQGLAILPEVGSQVVVAFEAGNLRRPYIVGAAWNGRAALPHNPERANNIRILRSRANSKLEFDDTAGAPKVTISTDAGHEVVLDEGTQEITIRHAQGCVIRLTATSVEITANLAVAVTAPKVDVTSPISKFSGVVQCATLKTNFVNSPAYSSGVGNLW